MKLHPEDFILTALNHHRGGPVKNVNIHFFPPIFEKKSVSVPMSACMCVCVRACVSVLGILTLTRRRDNSQSYVVDKQLHLVSNWSTAVKLRFIKPDRFTAAKVNQRQSTCRWSDLYCYPKTHRFWWFVTSSSHSHFYSDSMTSVMGHPRLLSSQTGSSFKIKARVLGCYILYFCLLSYFQRVTSGLMWLISCNHDTLGLDISSHHQTGNWPVLSPVVVVVKH